MMIILNQVKTWRSEKVIYGPIWVTITFVLNLIVVLISKYLLQSHYVALTFMINVSTVILPFVFAMLQYTISGVMFTLLANVYKKEISE